VKLSIVIVNYYHSHLLGGCLESIYLTVQETQFEIILINNSFRDDGLEAVLKCYPEIRLINNLNNIGFARANNQAAKIATGDYFLFINPDTTMTQGSIQAMLDYL
jgi:GT2 family glycosyltransferase